MNNGFTMSFQHIHHLLPRQSSFVIIPRELESRFFHRVGGLLRHVVEEGVSRELGEIAAKRTRSALGGGHGSNGGIAEGGAGPCHIVATNITSAARVSQQAGRRLGLMKKVLQVALQRASHRCIQAPTLLDAR